MSENAFVSNLLAVAKELEKLNQIRKFKKEFDECYGAELTSDNGATSSDQAMAQSTSSKDENKTDLTMNVQEEKTYDVDEIKNSNFQRVKSSMPKVNLIRTLVYKAPESSYVVKKCQVIVKEEKKVESKDSSSATSGESDVKKNEKSKEEIGLVSKKEPTPIATKPTPKVSVASNVAKSYNKSNSLKEVKKFTEEDLIVIDENDDIIGYSDDEIIG
jgi:hypothetical protein